MYQHHSIVIGYLVEAGSYQHWIIWIYSYFELKIITHPLSRKVIEEHEYLEEYCINLLILIYINKDIWWHRYICAKCSSKKIQHKQE